MLRYMGFHLYISTISRNSNRCSDLFCGDKTPQPSCDSPGVALGTGFPRPLESLRALCARFFSTPSHFVTARWGTGNRIPQTPWVATRAMRTFFSIPSHFVTAPVGHWGPYSPDPLGRFAPSGVITSG